MITEKDTIRCEAIFNDAHTHRLYWKRVWGKDKPLAAVIMLNPCLSDNISTDITTTLVVNNIARLGQYSGVVIVNLFSMMTTKLDLRWYSDEELNEEENDAYIRKAADECGTVILAWGKGAAIHPRLQERSQEVLELLQGNQAKLWVISDGERDGLHPLTPSVRGGWELKKYVSPTEDGKAAGESR